MRNLVLQVMGLLMFVVAGCGVSKEVYQGDVQRLKTQIGELEQQKMDLFRRYGETSQAKDACERELAAMQSKGSELGAGLRKALDRIKDLEAIAARQRAVFDRLRAALDELVKAGKLSIAVVRGQFTVQMADKILFDSGRYAIKPEAEETLRMLTHILAGVPNRAYQVAGHTDTDGEADFNWRLSSNRAMSVLQFMIKEGMPPERVSMAGYGEFQPTAANDSPESKALNRRIEIVLVPDMEEFMAPFREGPSSSEAPATPSAGAAPAK